MAEKALEKRVDEDGDEFVRHFQKQLDLYQEEIENLNEAISSLDEFNDNLDNIELENFDSKNDFEKSIEILKNKLFSLEEEADMIIHNYLETNIRSLLGHKNISSAYLNITENNEIAKHLPEEEDDGDLHLNAILEDEKNILSESNKDDYQYKERTVTEGENDFKIYTVNSPSLGIETILSLKIENSSDFSSNKTESFSDRIFNYLMIQDSHKSNIESVKRETQNKIQILNHLKNILDLKARISSDEKTQKEVIEALKNNILDTGAEEKEYLLNKPKLKMPDSIKNYAENELKDYSSTKISEIEAFEDTLETHPIIQTNLMLNYIQQYFKNNDRYSDLDDIQSAVEVSTLALGMNSIIYEDRSEKSELEQEKSQQRNLLDFISDKRGVDTLLELYKENLPEASKKFDDKDKDIPLKARKDIKYLNSFVEEDCNKIVLARDILYAVNERAEGMSDIAWKRLIDSYPGISISDGDIPSTGILKDHVEKNLEKDLILKTSDLIESAFLYSGRLTKEFPESVDPEFKLKDVHTTINNTLEEKNYQNYLIGESDMFDGTVKKIMDFYNDFK